MTVTNNIEFGDCRLLGHSWDSFTPVEKYRSVLRFVLHLRCDRCGTIRHDGFDSLGHLGSRSYEYPPNYRVERELRPTREELRLSAVKPKARNTSRKERS